MDMALRPNANHPELPIELWLDILRLATWVPDILVPNLAIDISPSADRARWKALKRSLVTKQYLVRVCRAWHSMALPFLWESIYVGKAKSLNTLCDSLGRSRGKYPCDESYEYTHGSWTKYINVFIRDSTDINNELQLLGEIFRKLPNLTTISFRINVAKDKPIMVPAFILRSIAETCGTCLQAITWSIPETLILKEDDWLAFLAKVPNIRTIRCPMDRYIDSRYPLLTGAEVEASQLPHLNFLSLFVPIYEKRLPLDNLPSLRHLTLEGSIGGYTSLKPILKKYGSRLETIQLDRVFHDSLSSNVSILISETCPNLTRLNVSVSRWGVLRSNFVLPESVEVFGIQCGLRSQASKRVYKSLFDVLCSLRFGTRFKVIQIIDGATVKDLRERHGKEVIDFTERLKTMGLVLHDHEGSLL